MTEVHKQAADAIVAAYKEKQGKAHNIHGFLGNLQDKAPLDALRYASHILLHKGILMAIDGVNRENLMHLIKVGITKTTTSSLKKKKENKIWKKP
jgi:hypothetical protein